MWSFIKEFFKTEGFRETQKMTFIQPIGDKFGLIHNRELVATYSRERDARRGATRRGFTVA